MIKFKLISFMLIFFSLSAQSAEYSEVSLLLEDRWKIEMGYSNNAHQTVFTADINDVDSMQYTFTDYSSNSPCEKKGNEWTCVVSELIFVPYCKLDGVTIIDDAPSICTSMNEATFDHSKVTITTKFREDTLRGKAEIDFTNNNLSDFSLEIIDIKIERCLTLGAQSNPLY